MHPSETHCHRYFDAFSHFCTLFDAWGLKWELWGASIRRWMCEYVCVENVRMCVFPNREHCVRVWLNQSTRVALKIAPFPKVFILRVILCKCHKQDNVLVHRNTPIYTGKLHSFEIKHTRDLTQHRKSSSCQKNQIRAGHCSHTSSCSRRTKTPSRRRASLWLPGTVEKCSNTEAQLPHEAPVHKHRFRHLNIRMLMRGTSWGLAHPPPASRNQMNIPYWWSEPMQVINCLYSFTLMITFPNSMRHWAKHTHVSKWMLLLIFYNYQATIYKTKKKIKFAWNIERKFSVSLDHEVEVIHNKNMAI